MVAWVGGLLALLLLLYARTLQGGILWDDDAHLTAPALQSLAGLRRIWFEIGATQQYYPLLHSAFWVEHQLWGDATLGYHVVNVLLHATAAGLFAGVLLRLRVRGAWLAAALFALHPVHVESVAWMTEQKNTLSAVFYLWAALTYLRFDERRRGRDYALAAMLFVAALLTKSVTATLPAALLVVLWWKRGALRLREDIAPLLPWFVAGATAGVFTAWVERTYIGASGAEFELGLVQRLLLAGSVGWFYLGKLLWPVDLSFVYPRWKIDAAWWPQWIPLLVTFGALAMCWRWRKRSRTPLAVLLLFGGTLFPVLGFLNVYPFRYSFVADHFQYLASLAVIAAVAAGFARVAEGRWRRIALAGAAVGLLSCALLTARQAAEYRDAGTLWRATLARNPGSSLAWVHLGKIHMQAGRHEEAVRCFRRAAEVNPRDADAFNNLGCELMSAGQLEEAVALFESALALKPDSGAHNNLGHALFLLGRVPEALQHYDEALRLRPHSPEAHNNLGIAFARMGRPAEALPHFEAALRGLATRPAISTGVQAMTEVSEALTRYNYGLALLQSGHAPAAVGQFERVLELNPESAQAMTKGGIALIAVGRPAEARTLLARATALEPASAEAHHYLGMAIANAGAPADSVLEFEKAIALAPGNAEYQLTLARVLEMLGRETEAAQMRDRAAATATPAPR